MKLLKFVSFALFLVAVFPINGMASVSVVYAGPEGRAAMHLIIDSNGFLNLYDCDTKAGMPNPNTIGTTWDDKMELCEKITQVPNLKFSILQEKATDSSWSKENWEFWLVRKYHASEFPEYDLFYILKMFEQEISLVGESDDTYTTMVFSRDTDFRKKLLNQINILSPYLTENQK